VKQQRGEAKHYLDDLRDSGLIEPDQHFLLMGVQGTTVETIEDTLFQALLDLLRSDIPLSRLTRHQTAGELERLRWPKRHAQLMRKTQVDRDRAHIASIADVLRAKGIRNFRGEAEREYALMQRVSVHTLRKRRVRRKK
jgi:hypothetical protein